MSAYLGEPRQVGYVVRDIDVAMKHWSQRLEVGPWFYKEDIGLTEFTYYGEPVAAMPKVSIALANSGTTQIELIQVRDSIPTAWSDSLSRNGEGPQHIAFWIENFDEVRTRLLEEGYVEAHAGRSGSRGRFCYVVHDDLPGSVIELSEFTGGKARYFEMIADAATHWDGTDPIRPQDA